jgi:signal transduction histidine kinase/ActR/RegA family two-component response regulator
LQARFIHPLVIPSSLSEPASELSYLRCQLLYGQTLHHLDTQLNDYVLAFLSETTGDCLESETFAEDAIFQSLVENLSHGLGDVPAAIAFPRPSNHPTEPIYELQQVASCPETPDNRSTNSERARPGLRPLSSRKADFQTGQSLTSQELSKLQSQFPHDIFPVVQHPSGMIWLLLDRAHLELADHPDLEEHWIEQMLTRSVVALEQVRRIQLRRQDQQALVNRNRELEQTNQLKSEFLANTSHEIRTPLSSILGFTHLLQQQGYNPINLRHQEYLKIILTSGQHLLALINDILDLSKIEANQLSLEWETVDVAKVCEVAMMLVREKASDRGLTLQLEIDPSITTIVVDSLRLKQMLFNLLSNAVKFTLRGAIGLQVSPVDQNLHFTVWDTGTGISEEQQAVLFKPYSQVANSAVTRGEGTGLGLVLTQKLAELHGGCIEVASTLNRGSRFTVIIPGQVGAVSGQPNIAPQDITPQDITPKVVLSAFPTPTLSTTASTTTTSTTTASTNASTSTASTTIPAPSSSPVLLSQRAQKPESYASPPLAASSTSHLSSSFSPLETIPAHSTQAALTQSNKVLLVEDNIHNAKLILTYLNRLGCEVVWAKDGKEMWQLLAQSGAEEMPLTLPSLILMDVNLPDIDGLTLTRQLKTHQPYAQIPVIVQTAMAMKGDRDHCLEAGANDYLSKPIDLDVLTDLVTQYAKPNRPD